MNKAKEQKTWKELRQRRALTVSASQIATAHLCIRKWWEERVRRLQKQSEQQSQFVFGSVFHACVERFLLADDTGRDKKTGKPVELFPDGWKSDIDPYTGEVVGTVNEEEAGIIKALVLKGIESGVLAPYPDRQVEREIRVPLGKIDAPNGPVTVSFMGFIDCASRNMIVDHKTTSNMRYALSPAKLASDPQMTIYGKMWLDHLRSIGERPDSVVLRHNQFCKDPKKLQVRSTETTVSASYIEHMWQKSWLPTIEKMVRYRDTANKWSDMPEPATGPNACNKYGGCEYMNICGGRITEEQMQKRLDKALDTRAELVTLTVTSPNTRNNNMGQTMQERLAAMKAARQAAAEDTKPELKAEPVKPKAEPKPADTPEGMTPPPWAQADCTACGGCGFNTKGNPCRICAMKADEDKKPERYLIEAMKDGSFIWASKEDEDDAGMSPGPSFNRSEPEVSERVKEEVVEEPKAAPAPKAKTTPAATEEVEDIDPKEAASANTDYGFTLLINCRPTKSGRGIPKPFDLHDILDDAKNKMAEASGVTSFYDLDPFKRRDKIAELAPQVATALGKGVIFACGVGTGASEHRALLDGLKPLAKQVIVSDVN